MNSFAIEAKGLSKWYGKEKTLAVDRISLEVGPGELFGLIGPDGAGKTSIFRMLTTLLLPDAGTAQVGGMDVVKDYQRIRNSVGYMPGRFSLYQDLSVEENLSFFATVFNTSIAENYQLIEDIYVQIEPFKKRLAGQLSGGMKQKLALCCALIHKPEVLFLDEPTTGVDPVSRKEFWEMLARLKARGITILVATPYMDEAALCERIALIQEGRILQVDTPAAIRAAYPDRLYAVKAGTMSATIRAMNTLKGVIRCYGSGEFAHAAVAASGAIDEAVIKAHLIAQGHSDPVVRPVLPTIEDVFIKCTLDRIS